jgi:hypothetical protein
VVGVFYNVVSDYEWGCCGGCSQKCGLTSSSCATTTLWTHRYEMHPCPWLQKMHETMCCGVNGLAVTGTGASIQPCRDLLSQSCGCCSAQLGRAQLMSAFMPYTYLVDAQTSSIYDCGQH